MMIAAGEMAAGEVEVSLDESRPREEDTIQSTQRCCLVGSASMVMTMKITGTEMTVILLAACRPPSTKSLFRPRWMGAAVVVEAEAKKTRSKIVSV